ncbi:MbnP family protein [Hymenobacter persicinus]|uniref:Copper-binding protein MbnP-like domain-containing protein n=1 Tax=Hymenobacter persicinus TaxID=2025506 RepID=A0A4Q5LBD7_9BACT|nr:MbnP family protein [Hymenobacter persicinus]RYU79602.1 hypothetical protein EWM57_10580 [Hymenobacter persicinus]
MTMKLSAPLLSLALAAVALSGCDKKKADPAAPQTGSVSIALENVVGPNLLKLSTSPTVYDYATASNEQFNVSHFHYFVSNIKLRRADGTEYAEPESYHLVEESAPDSKTFVLKDVPVGEYTGLSFLVGVDAARNTSGAQQGALAPSTDTFWNWTTGYIFVKMEGYSPQAPGSHAMQFHIGGFADPNNALRTVAPALPAGTTVQVRQDYAPEVHLKADLLRMFTGPNPVSFATFASPHMPGANAVKVADNYAAGMFEVEYVQNK